MDVTNIFGFVRPRSDAIRQIEDGLSISFGFILSQKRGLRSDFIERLGLKSRNIKNVKIRTQESIKLSTGKLKRIDLQIEEPNEFLIILESKIVPHQPKYIEQLANYTNYLKEQKAFYQQGVRLVYVTKFTIPHKERKAILKRLNLNEQEFVCFSWDALIDFINKKQDKFTKMFIEWIGDRMRNTKLISKQRIEDITEVLAVYTNPLFMKLLEEKNIIVQKLGSPDALYIAIIMTHRGGKQSAITHICKVRETRIELASQALNNWSGLEEYKRWGNYKDLNWELKVYYLDGKPKKLLNEIPMGGQKGQVNFNTTFAEFVTKSTAKEMKTVGQIGN